MTLKGYCRETRPYIKIQNVSFGYQDGNSVLTEINTSFCRGEFTAIIGPNGSGKTTLGKLMMGLLKPFKGDVLIAGNNTKELSLGKIGNMVGYLFQQPERQVFTATVTEEIGFVLSFMDKPQEYINSKVKEMLEAFSLTGLEESSIYKLSRGERQRVALAAILINGPSFLILDEPTTGLDIVRKRKLSRILKELQSQGIGLAVISHDQEFIEENADRIIRVSGGGISETGSSY